jgi:hypothetical protein
MCHGPRGNIAVTLSSIGTYLHTDSSAVFPDIREHSCFQLNTVEVWAEDREFSNESLRFADQKPVQMLEPCNRPVRPEQRKHFKETRARGAPRHANPHRMNENARFKAALSCGFTHRRFHM